MEAIRQFVEVKDNSFNVFLPKNFKAKSVEIIIIPNEEDEYEELSDDLKAILDERLQEKDEDCISAEESIKILKQKYGL